MQAEFDTGDPDRCQRRPRWRCTAQAGAGRQEKLL